MINERKRRIINIFLMILIGLLVVMFAFVNIVQYKQGLNADVASDGVLASILWNSKEWVPDEWYIANETRLVGIANIAALFYGLTKNICLSMGLACIAGMVLILVSATMLCRELNFDSTKSLLFLMLVLLLPNNKIQLELMYIYAAYYSIHIAVCFFSLALYLKLINKKRVNMFHYILMLGIHFLLGAQGVRGILMVTGPMLAVEVARRAYLWWCGVRWNKKENEVTLYVLLLNAVEFVGGLLPISIGIPMSRNIRKAPEKLVRVVWNDFLSTFDWHSISFWEKVALVIGCIAVILGIFKIIKKAILKKEISSEEWIFTNFVASVFLTIMALTFTTVDSSSRYFVMMFIAIAMAIVMIWKRDSKIINIVLAVVVIIWGICNFARVYYPMVTDQSYKNSEYIKVGNYLIQEGYEYAYTNFDHANTFTVMNDGKVQVCAVDSLGKMNICKWMTSKKWYVPNVEEDSKTAYIISEYRLQEFEEFLQEHSDVKYETTIDGFYIYSSDINYSKLTD